MVLKSKDYRKVEILGWEVFKPSVFLKTFRKHQTSSYAFTKIQLNEIKQGEYITLTKTPTMVAFTTIVKIIQSLNLAQKAKC